MIVRGIRPRPGRAACGRTSRRRLVAGAARGVQESMRWRLWDPLGYGEAMISPLSDIEIRLKRLPHGADLPLPHYATDHAAGMDVGSAESVVLEPGARL